MEYKIAVVEGDGIGPEIIASAIAVMDAVGAKHNHKFEYDFVPAGGNSIDKYGVPLTDEALERCLRSDSVLLGAVGGPKWDTLPGHLRPERALLGIRKELGLFANIRPAKLNPVLKSACPLKDEIASRGFDMVIVRELTGGMYYGERGRRQGKGGEEAFDTECYSEAEIERIARVAFDIAAKRSKRVISVDKANVLESSRLWREVVHRAAKDYPEIAVSDMLVDNAAMQLIKNPAQFDVVVTSNMFGDILSDEASQITGSIGLLPSASLGEGTRGMYEPIHGSAPDIAGKDLANPIATILSVAMMFRLSFNLDKEADEIEAAVDAVLNAGYRTRDILDNATEPLGCKAMTQKIIEYLTRPLQRT
ncbi:MAG TPA: 3-isopropylmalate dehydrogenase [Clostridia bacterium]|jgi:3-isopropylmalate dehydrogenase|nr:3-isopropylmalate dehydrogenase [Clostridia bacterium]HOK82328.1 3-isopropylmalate dehydrogenase [Clostridia bacterium]HOL61140.1 3-isopropylmalate dehydrogenase [Clostridia bacterium]HPO53726.1 3-isopropylmalate dehydrogenase [Clostridia bacterium]